jgi:hypothetical protein
MTLQAAGGAGGGGGAGASGMGGDGSDAAPTDAGGEGCARGGVDEADFAGSAPREHPKTSATHAARRAPRLARPTDVTNRP